MVDLRRPVLSGAAVACLLLALAALLLGPLGTAPARAASAGATAEGVVPDDVCAAFEGQALRRGIATPETQQLAQVRAGTVHQLFTYTADFVQGDPTADPVEPLQEWVAGIEGDGAPRGWLRVWKPDGGPAAPTGWTADPVVGQELLSTTASALVEVPWDAAYFTLVDGVATPVHVSEWDWALGPRSLAEVQQAFAQERAESQGCGGDACVGGGGSGSSSLTSVGAPSTLLWAGVFVLAAAAGVVALLGLRRRGGGKAEG